MNIIVNILRKLNFVPVPLVDTASQLFRARAVLEANYLGVFSTLEQGNGLTAEEVAKRAEISKEGASVLLSALAATGYLRRQDGRYWNGPWVRRWITDPKRGLSNYLKLQMNVWHRLEKLGETVRIGKPPIDYHLEQVSVHSEEQDVYTKAMRELASFLLPDFLKRVKLPPGAKRLLDIGGAHGEYCRALIARYPGLKATVLDLEGPITSAKKIIEAEGNPEKIEFISGNALEADLGSGWDVVLLVNLIHIFTPEQNGKLFQKIRHALSPQGVLVIMDQFTGVSSNRDLVASLHSLNFFNIGGRCYDWQEMKNLLTQAGFQRTVFKKSPPWQPSGLFEAWK